MQKRTAILLLRIFSGGIAALFITSCDHKGMRHIRKDVHDHERWGMALLSSYGLYAEPWKISSNAPPRNGFTTSDFYKKGIVCLQRSDTIEASPLTMIGVECTILTIDPFGTDWFTNGGITTRIIPPHPIQVEEAEQPQAIFEKVLRYDEVENFGGIYWGFGEEKYRIPGEWMFQILHGKYVILEKILDVSFTSSPPVWHYDYSRNRDLGETQTSLGLFQYGEVDARPEWSDKGVFFLAEFDKFSRVMTDSVYVNQETLVMGVSFYWMGLRLDNIQECFIFKLIPPKNDKDDANNHKDFVFSCTREKLWNDGMGCCFKFEGINDPNFIPGAWTLQVTNVDDVVLAEKRFFLQRGGIGGCSF